MPAAHGNTGGRFSRATMVLLRNLLSACLVILVAPTAESGIAFVSDRKSPGPPDALDQSVSLEIVNATFVSKLEGASVTYKGRAGQISRCRRAVKIKKAAG